ncbi:MAG TPA: SLBB domain-containing protein [Chitinophagaceae bacterium]|nr:SLBB domain-containing protein [Chitinophagaceae bacterium]
MKKIFLLFLVLTPYFLMAQPGGNKTNPVVNPYDTNPYNPNQQNSTNFFEPDNKNDQKDKQNNSKDNQNPNQTNNPNKPNQFQDLNSKRSSIEEQQIQELYKNDPDYLEYLRATKEEEVKIDTLNRADSLKKSVYGANFFSNNVFDLSDKTPVAPPLDYRLGPGDEIIVSIWGDAELQQSYVIAKDGSIFPRLVGKIFLQGLTFDAASRIIAQKFRKVVPSATNVDVQMGKSRTIRVTIVGEVKKQGTYTISAFNSALNALFKAGGLTDLGNLRKIEIRREGHTVDILDLYEYLNKGGRGQELYLEDNDYIYVGLYEKKVNAIGSFKRPMFYQLTNDEGLTDLIEFAGGASFNARNSLVHIKTVSNEQERYIDLASLSKQNTVNNQYVDLILNDGDEVSLKPINEGLSNIVKIEGAVNYPDEYEVKEGEHLSDVLRRAGGISGTAYLPRAFILRGSNALESSAIKVDLTNIDDPTNINNIEVFAGDKIKVLSNKDFEQPYKIEVIGYVRKPGKIPYYKNMKLKDVLLLTGGLRLDAENGRIEVSNVVDSVNKYTINSKGSNVKIISINANLEIDQASENIVLKPMDRVYVRKKTEFLSQNRVSISGEVAYGGEYALVEKNERISSLIKRSGGTLSTAYVEGAKLIRPNVGQIVIDLPAAIANPGSKQDLVLKDSDIIIVPSVNEIVQVRGEVQLPVNIKFDNLNTSVKYYIGAAGGYGDNPWRSRINVKYSNGKVRSTKNFLFFRKYPPVKEGSTVRVPTKPKKENKTDLKDIVTITTTFLTTVATLILVYKTVK